MDEEEGNSVQKPSCCSTVRFLGVKEAQGFAILGVTRGTIVMSNIYLSSSLLYLANVEAGCDMDDVNNCSKEVFGFRPSSLLTITVTVSGVLAALLMPVIGAIVDFTPHRKLLGILSAFSIVMIQSIQILTNQKTWFVMSILQALAGFLYIVQVLATYAYLPEVGRLVDELTMTKFTSRFTMIQFGGQSLYLIIITAVALVFELNEVKLAQCSQTINAFIILIFFTIAWKLLPSRPQIHDLNGKNIIMAGFIQNWNTMKGINKHYAKGLRFFLIASCFTSAGANAFSTISVTYLYEVLQMKGNEIGIIFLISLVISVPGAFFGGFVTGKTNPITSLKINLISFSLVTVAAAFILTGPSRTNICYIFACLWGICLGWYVSLFSFQYQNLK